MTKISKEYTGSLSLFYTDRAHDTRKVNNNWVPDGHHLTPIDLHFQSGFTAWMLEVIFKLKIKYHQSQMIHSASSAAP